MRRPYRDLLIVTLLLAAPVVTLRAQDSQVKTAWDVRTVGGYHIPADSFRVEGAATVRFFRDGQAISLPIDSIGAITRTERERSRGRGAMIGAFTLGATGAMLGRYLDGKETETTIVPTYGGMLYYTTKPSESNHTVLLGLGGVLVGSIIGAIAAPEHVESTPYLLGGLSTEARAMLMTTIASPEGRAALGGNPPEASVGSLHLAVGIARALPVGDFGDSSPSNPEGGAAEPGYAGCARLSGPLRGSAEWTVSVLYASNRVNTGFLGLPYEITIDAHTWRSLWMMGGARLSGQATPAIAVFGLVETGVMVGWSPEIEFSLYGQQLRQNSSSAAALGASFGGGLTIQDRVEVAASYRFAKPTYDLSASAGGETTSAKAQQATGMILLSLSVTFR